MTTKTLASSLAALALFAAQGAVEPVWPEKLVGDLTTMNAVGFEHFAVGATPATGLADDGTDGTANDKSFFLYSGTSDGDNSVVTNRPVNFDAGNVPAYFSGLANTNYLALSTEGGTLFRSINHIDTSGENPALGAAESIPASGLFVDTLVQFTPCEEAPSLDGNDNKLAIWLGTETNGVGDVVGTNLCVRAGYWTKDGDNIIKTASKTYNLFVDGTTFQTGTWYRLTVQALAAVTSENHPAFKIFIDGNVASSTNAAASAETGLAGDFQDGGVTVTFPSMKTDADLTAVGFQGTGAVDDFVVTTDAPGFLSLDFTLNWDANVTAIKAVLNYPDSPVTFTEFTVAGAGSTNLPVSAGQTITFLYSDVVHAAGSTEAWTTTGSTEGSLNATAVEDYDEDFNLVTIGYSYTIWSAGGIVNLAYEGGTPAGPFGGGTGTELDPYIISSADHLTELATGVDGGDTYSGKFFALSGNIDMTSAGAWDGIGEYNSSTKLFAGTFDGKGYTISNLLFAPAKYRGFFDQLEGTVSNLTINVAGFAATAADEHGYAAFAGNMKNAKIVNCVATGTIGTSVAPAMHTCGGFAVKVTSNSMFENCTNYVDIVCGLDDNPKIGGIVGLAIGAAITNCWNYGDMTITFEDCINDANGAGGFIGYSQTTPCTISGGGNFGTISKGNAQSQREETKYPVHLGTIIARAGSAVNVSDGTVAQADAVPAEMGTLNGATYATVDNGVATFVSALETNNEYKVMMPVSAGVVYTLESAGAWIAFNTNMVSFAGSVNGGTNLRVETTDESGIVTYTAVALIDASDAEIALSTNSAVWSAGIAFPTVSVTLNGDAIAQADYSVAWSTGGVDVAEIAEMAAGEDPIVYTATVTINGSRYIPGTTKTDTFTVSAPEGGKTINPDGTPLDVVAESAEAATNGVEIVITDSAAAAAGQAAVVKLVATPDSGNPGHYSVSVAINEEAEAFVAPDEAVAEVAGVLSGSAASVSVPANKLTPGLYYSLAVSTSVDGTYTEGTRTLATGSEAIQFSINKPEGGKAFYKVLVNMTNNE